MLNGMTIIPKMKSQSKVALTLATITLTLLFLVSAIVHSTQYYLSLSNNTTTDNNIEIRNLDEQITDYSSYKCDDIFTYTQPNTPQQCSFAQSCNSNQGLFASSFIFCSYNHSSLYPTTKALLLSPFLLTYLLLLFKALGSTAEDFFSPSLEMFSVKLGLPPRFAGVTLLALGNGAADVSATISAITINPQEGYLMSLGALTGAGMFVGTVISAVVIIIAEGVRCRGALVRDVVMLAITVVVVFWIFSPTFGVGHVGLRQVHTFFFMYLAFVLIVLIADVYHRAVVLPRMRRNEELVAREQRLQYQEQKCYSQPDEIVQVGGGVPSLVGSQLLIQNNDDGVIDSSYETAQENLSRTATMDSESDNGNQHPTILFSHTTSSTSKNNNQITSITLPTLHEHEITTTSSLPPNHTLSTTTTTTRPNLLSSSPPYQTTTRFQRVVDGFMGLFSNYDKNETQSSTTNNNTTSFTSSFYNPNTSYSGWGMFQLKFGPEADKATMLHGTHGILNTKKSNSYDNPHNHHHNNNNTLDGYTNMNSIRSSYTALLDGMEHMCLKPGSVDIQDWSDSNEWGADDDSHVPVYKRKRVTWSNMGYLWWEELRVHFINMKNDVFGGGGGGSNLNNEEYIHDGDEDEDDENSYGLFDKFMFLCEFPLIFFRKFTIPIPCEGYYSRGLVAASCICAPLWIGFYSFIENDVDLFFTGGFPYIEISLICSLLVGVVFMRFAPVDEERLSLKASVPIALLGFIIAATWIDTIADLLVSLLNFLGVICRIPGPIMGLTILAWGNSMGDLSANMTMAKKGLANMAITACFAGPVFNILVGLGGGFSNLNSSYGRDETDVYLTPSIIAGFAFMMSNIVLVLLFGTIWNGHLPKQYGYAALALYVVYVSTTIFLELYER